MGPQHDRIYPDGNAYFTDADALRLLPREQQLRAEFNSLLRLPFGCLAKHHDPGRRGAESYYGRVSDRLFDLPFHCELDDLDFQSQPPQPSRLTGAHTTVACALCHVNGNYSGTLPTDCYSCHTAAWQSTTTLGGSVPNHITSGYPTTCASCHTTTSWLGAVFNHNATGFPLTGAHTTVACNLCHTSSNPPPTDCYSCHTAQWQSTATLGGNGAKSPRHRRLRHRNHPNRLLDVPHHDELAWGDVYSQFLERESRQRRRRLRDLPYEFHELHGFCLLEQHLPSPVPD